MGVRVNDDLVLIGGAMQGYERNKQNEKSRTPAFGSQFGTRAASSGASGVDTG